ncbi:MAG: ABC transporter ATP-binding protein [Paludibacteraceae bacterium]|nr:ABC transporter ATP-binding protein [Paludibacteraceae bacterium]MBQ6724243.1 ABC transporter ATP-binding protein [Paludibacteraceae bacterium]
MANAIEFENVSKQYRLGLVSTGTLRHDINRWWQTSILGKEDPYLKIGETNDRSTKGNSEYVWALKDINFKVEQGDVVGIIGKNGAGKSTLLKLLSRVTGPTTGVIRAHGRIGSLLEVGTGFHGEMTGRENIFMNGAILGMTRQEIQAKLDEIIDFSGCERYIDTPVKRYSSGMTVRLGFAVAAFLDPEILVVDEVLAVGDAEFQKKAIGKMKDVSSGEGRTVLFVSHNMGSIRSLCKRGILLENGSIKADGEVNSICDMYLSDSLVNLGAAWEREFNPNKDFQITKVELLDSKGEGKNLFSCDEEWHVRMTAHVKNRVPGIYGYLQFTKADGVAAWVSDSNDIVMNKLETLPLGESQIDILIPKRSLAPGSYSVYLNFTSSQNISGWNVDSPFDVCVFNMTDDRTFRGDKRPGYMSTLLDWKFV